MRRILLVSFLCLSVILTGCESTKTGAGVGVRWYNPTTWFSGSEGRRATQNEVKRDEAKEQAINQAKLSAHETQEALDRAGDSREVEVAKDSNDTTVTLLDQATGVPTAKQLADIKEKVRLLTSQVAEERARGEKMRGEDQDRISKLSAKLAELEAQKAKFDKDLAAAFVRENSLANELRNERWWSWFWRIAIGATAIIGFAGWIYVRLTLGGLPTALGKSISHLRSSSPEIAAQLTNVLDVNLSPAEQSLIRLLAAKHQ